MSGAQQAELFAEAPVAETFETPDSFNEIARAKLGIVGWRWCKSEVTADGFFMVTGAVYPLRKDGSANWAKRDQSTQRTIIITSQELRAFEANWMRMTGKCWRCAGSGRDVASVSVDRGTEYRPCGKCNATGKAPTP